jgi:hypothetical protein
MSASAVKAKRAAARKAKVLRLFRAQPPPTLAAAAEEVGCTRERVRQILVAAGVERRSRAAWAADLDRRLAAILPLARAQRWRLRDIAAALSCSTAPLAHRGLHGFMGAGNWRPLQPCGTRSAYARHRRRGEPTCQPCRDANTADCRLRKSGSKRRSA